MLAYSGGRLMVTGINILELTKTGLLPYPWSRKKVWQHLPGWSCLTPPRVITKLYSMLFVPLYDVEVSLTPLISGDVFYIIELILIQLIIIQLSTTTTINQPTFIELRRHSTCRPGKSMTYSSGSLVSSFSLSFHLSSSKRVVFTPHTYIPYLVQSPCSKYLIIRPALYRRERFSPSRPRRCH